MASRNRLNFFLLWSVRSADPPEGLCSSYKEQRAWRNALDLNCRLLFAGILKYSRRELGYSAI
jgi:hypothetical protein